MPPRFTGTGKSGISAKAVPRTVGGLPTPIFVAVIIATAGVIGGVIGGGYGNTSDVANEEYPFLKKDFRTWSDQDWKDMLALFMSFYAYSDDDDSYHGLKPDLAYFIQSMNDATGEEFGEYLMRFIERNPEYLNLFV